MHATREEHVGLTNKRTTRHPLSHQLSASNERIATMGNCMTCLRSPDADSEPAGASGQRAHKSDATVLDTVLGCTAGGIASGAGAAIADHVSERSGAYTSVTRLKNVVFIVFVCCPWQSVMVCCRRVHSTSWVYHRQTDIRAFCGNRSRADPWVRPVAMRTICRTLPLRVVSRAFELGQKTPADMQY